MIEAVNQILTSKYLVAFFVVAASFFGGAMLFKLDTLDNRVNKIENVDLPQIRKDIQDMDRRVIKIEARLDNIERRLDEMQADIKELRSDVKTILTILAGKNAPLKLGAKPTSPKLQSSTPQNHQSPNHNVPTPDEYELL